MKMITSIVSIAWGDKKKYIYIHIYINIQMNWVEGGSCSDRHSLLRGRIYMYIYIYIYKYTNDL